jgi:hypothetical protein
LKKKKKKTKVGMMIEENIQEMKNMIEMIGKEIEDIGIDIEIEMKEIEV